MTALLRAEMAAFLLAWQFLTRVPVPRRLGFTPQAMAMTPRYFPAVGALVGLAGAAVLLVAVQALPMAVAVLLSLAATCALTGALHEDGLADTFDGMGATSAERALEIMKDSRIGTYGGLALGLVLAVKVAALVAMTPTTAAAALVAGHGASRLSSVVVIATSRYVRLTGTGAFTAEPVSPGGFAVATGFGVLSLTGVAVLAGPTGLIGAVGGLAVGHLLARSLFERRLGGYTGDCLGATQQVSEVCLYLGLLACL